MRPNEAVSPEGRSPHPRRPPVREYRYADVHPDAVVAGDLAEHQNDVRRALGGRRLEPRHELRVRVRPRERIDGVVDGSKPRPRLVPVEENRLTHLERRSSGPR